MIAEQLQSEVERMMRDKEAIQCVVMTADDFKSLTGKDAGAVDDFGSFLGIPIRLGNRTHVRATLPFRLKKLEREGSGDV